MNAGFMAIIGIWFLILFLWLGWLDSFLEKSGMKKRYVFLFLLFSLCGMWWTVALPVNGQLSIIAFGMPFMISLILWGREEERTRLHILASAFLVGSSVFLLRLLLRLDPVLMVVNEKYMLSLLTAILVIVAVREATQQFILLSLGLTLCDICSQIYLWQFTGSYHLGDAAFADLWWISLYLIGFYRALVGKLRIPSIFRRKRAETTS